MNMSKSRDIQAKMPSPKVIYASNESKSVLARNLEECRDNDKNSQSVFLSFTVKPLTFRMEKSANYPYHLLRMIYSFYIYAGTASFGGSHPNAFNFFKYAWIFRSALN